MMITDRATMPVRRFHSLRSTARFRLRYSPMSAKLGTLLDMLTYCRPAGSGAESAFIARFIATLPGATCDPFGNWHVVVGTSPILWSCHTDTVHDTSGRQTVHVAADGIVGLSRRSRPRSSCLGGGVALPSDDPIWCAGALHLSLRRRDRRRGVVRAGAVSWRYAGGDQVRDCARSAWHGRCDYASVRAVLLGCLRGESRGGAESERVGLFARQYGRVH